MDKDGSHRNSPPAPSRCKRQPFRGRPPPTARRPDDGMPIVVVVPTSIDVACRFCDVPFADGSMEHLDMLQNYAPDLRTPERRLLDGLGTAPTAAATAPGAGGPRDGWEYDSQEIGVQCFDDGRWPERTDLRCWWCLHGFETRPFPCPMHIDPDGRMRIRGVFCGPSCAKAWAFAGDRTANHSHIDAMINSMAKMRGFRHATTATTLYIPPAPPREALDIFCGSGGMTIEQFRGMCAAGFNVTVLFPPFITEKQVIVAECDRMARIVRHQGRVGHVDAPEGFMVPAVEYARRRREGMEIFAGVGARRLTDFINQRPAAVATMTTPPVPRDPRRSNDLQPPRPPPICAPPTRDNDTTTLRRRQKQATAEPAFPSIGVRNGRMKRPLPEIEPLARRRRTPPPPTAASPLAKRQKTGGCKKTDDDHH